MSKPRFHLFWIAEYQDGTALPQFDPDTGKPMLDETGEVIMIPAVVRRFSDKMLEMLAKKNMREYRDNRQVDVNVTGGVLAIPTLAAQTVEDWEDKYSGATVDAQFERVKPEAPPEIHDVQAPAHPEGPCGMEDCAQCRPDEEKPKPKREIRRSR